MHLVHITRVENLEWPIGVELVDCWRVRMDPRKLNAGSHLLHQVTAPMSQWCADNVGEDCREWRRFISSFIFLRKQDAMLFKLTWHGVQLWA